MYALLHFLHILSGIGWAGGALLIPFTIYPALLFTPKDSAQNFLAIFESKIGTFMGALGGLAMLTGLIRLWESGRIGSWSLVFSTGSLLAILALLIVGAHGAMSSREVARLKSLIDTEAPEAEKSSFMLSARIATAAMVTAVVAIMAFLGLGIV